MKRFKVYNVTKNQEIRVTLFQPPYENENILYKTKWKEKDCEITEMTMKIVEDEE